VVFVWLLVGYEHVSLFGRGLAESSGALTRQMTKALH
jgi:hypothetical protein